MGAQGKETLIRDLKHAIEMLSPVDFASGLIPQGGISLAYALPGARTCEDVAYSIDGQMFLSEDAPAVRMVLTAIRFDPTIRCIGIMKYSPAAISICNSMVLEICTFNRTLEPPGTTGIDWGVAFCCEQSDGVPDIIYDTGSGEKEALIRILGENPGQVTARFNRIITRIMNTNLTEE